MDTSSEQITRNDILIHIFTYYVLYLFIQVLTVPLLLSSLRYFKRNLNSILMWNERNIDSVQSCSASTDPLSSQNVL